MRYFILKDYLGHDKRKELLNKNLYCYDLRANDNYTEILSIEKTVIVNRYGTLITNAEIKLDDLFPNDFILFEDFKKNNKEVFNIKKLNESS